MHNLRFVLDGAWQVLLVGLLLGAGLPTLFALGVRGLAHGSGDGDVEATATVSSGGLARRLSTAGAVVCFALVALGILAGITIVVASGFGKEVGFEHVVPTFRDK